MIAWPNGELVRVKFGESMAAAIKEQGEISDAKNQGLRTNMIQLGERSAREEANEVQVSTMEIDQLGTNEKSRNERHFMTFKEQRETLLDQAVEALMKMKVEV